MVKCKICNKEMSIITNTHLKKHNLTCQYYKSKYNIDELISIETRELISKYLSKENNPMYGKRHNENTKRKISEANKGRLVGEKNPSNRKEVRGKISKSMMGHTVSQYTKEKASITHKGKKLSEKHKLILKEKALNNNPMNIPFNRLLIKIKLRKNFIDGKSNHNMENNPRWMGGISFESYGIDFNKKLKNTIKERDNYECQDLNCEGKSKKLNIHHIDYNKKNCHPDNLITLCNSCHNKIGKNNREGYKLKYSYIILNKGGDAHDTEKNNTSPFINQGQ